MVNCIEFVPTIQGNIVSLVPDPQTTETLVPNPAPAINAVNCPFRGPSDGMSLSTFGSGSSSKKIIDSFKI